MKLGERGGDEEPIQLCPGGGGGNSGLGAEGKAGIELVGLGPSGLSTILPIQGTCGCHTDLPSNLKLQLINARSIRPLSFMLKSWMRR